jgi:hypothetical protein
MEKKKSFDHQPVNELKYNLIISKNNYEYNLES